MNKSYEATMAAAERYGVADLVREHAASGTKFFADDLVVSPLAGELHAVANIYAARYEGTFDFMLAIQYRVETRGGCRGDALVAVAEAGKPMSLSTPGEAKAVLNCLVAEVRRQGREAEGPNTEPVTEPGLYLHGGTAFKVQASKSSGRLYAKRLVLPSHPGGKARFEYANGIVFQILASERVTLEQARAFAGEHGYCVNCGTYLSDPQSIDRGIGPVCEKRILGAAAPKRITGKAAPKSDLRLAREAVQ